MSYVIEHEWYSINNMVFKHTLQMLEELPSCDFFVMSSAWLLYTMKTLKQTKYDVGYYISVFVIGVKTKKNLRHRLV